jgi:hypothetical protein
MRPRQACGNPLYKFGQLSVAIYSTVILFLAIRSLNTADCHDPQDAVHLSAEPSICVQSSCRHFLSRVPLFDASLLFDGQLFMYKTDTLKIV